MKCFECGRELNEGSVKQVDMMDKEGACLGRISVFVFPCICGAKFFDDSLVPDGCVRIEEVI